MPPISPEESIFYAALELTDAEARSDYISRACGSDRQLTQRVEKLISAYSEGEFLESPIGNMAATALLPTVGEQPGDTIGPYKLLEQIGEGGMGIVFMAEQTRPFRRRVALKLIKPGLDTRAVIARFDAERQALALMDHPNIARVYDAGATNNGRPYFVMELVRGAPITDYCVARDLLLRERLNLFIEVCHAVQHAHQNGLIHRDLKPTNILVTQSDTQAIPKVIDFGVAKATTQPLTEKTLFTGFSQVIGTPLYMSPEQADLGNQDVDTRSDVYSLGVILYELLTGFTPFDAEWLRSASHDEMLRIIREEEPPKPSTRVTTVASALSTVAAKQLPGRLVEASALKGDLDWIVMSALEKDRRRRYETPSALASDIVRYLRNEPVDAFPPTRHYQLVKFARRNRIALLTTIAIASALMLGLGLSLWQAFRATAAEQRANVALAQARRAVDDMYTGVAEKWLESQGSLTAVQRELLEKALDFYKSLAANPVAAAEVDEAATNSLLRLGRIHARLGDDVDAERSFKQAIEQSEQSVQNSDRHDSLMALVDARTNLARLYQTTGHTEKMVEQAALAAKHLSALRRLKFSKAEDQERLAKTLSLLSTALSMSNRPEQANESVELALDLWKSLVAGSPENFDYRYGLALAKTRQGTAQMWWRSDDDSAERNLREADVLLTALLKERPGDAGCRRTLSRMALTNLGNLLAWMNRPEAAIEPHRRSLAFSEALAKEFPDDEADQGDYLDSLTNLASTISTVKQGKPGETLGLFTTAHGVAAQLIRRYPNSVHHKTAFLNTFIEVSRGLHVQGKHRETLEFCQNALPELCVILNLPGNEGNREFAHDCLSLLAALHIDFGNHAEAAKTLRLYTKKRFDSDFKNIYQKNAGDLQTDIVANFDSQSFVLMKPAILYEECAELVKHDTALSDLEKTTAFNDHHKLARSYREEALRAIEAWVAALDIQGTKAALSTAYEGELKVVEMLNWNNDGRTSPTWRRAQATICRLMVQKLVEHSARQLAEEPTQCYFAQLLSAAPKELRDVDLALKMARRSVELAPNDKTAQCTLAWALFRASDLQGCIDIFAKKVVEDLGPQSIFTMALWKAGRRDEALALFERAPERLEAWERSDRERRVRNNSNWPTVSMIRRLHKEAGATVSVNPAAKDPAASTEGEPGKRP